MVVSIIVVPDRVGSASEPDYRIAKVSSPSCRHLSVLKTQVSSLGFSLGDLLPCWGTKQIIAPISDRVKRDWTVLLPLGLVRIVWRC